MKISGRRIETGAPCYIIAEMSANHGQDFEQAVRILQAAKTAGADAIKLQTYTPDTLTIDCNNEHFRVGQGTIWAGKNLHALYREACTPWEWQPKLKKVAADLGMDCFSTPFDATAVDFLEAMGVPAHKIASFELVDHALLQRVARTGKPIILSTGMSTLEEIEEAVRVIRDAGGTQLALMKCTSAYPAAPEEMNLRTIPDMAKRFGVPVGLSDHTLGVEVPVAAVALGACLVEKHLTLSRKTPGPDNAFSLEPDEFKQMVGAIRVTEKALGCVSYELTKGEAATRAFRRSLFVVKDVRVGDLFTEKNVRSIRPGYGLPPKHLPEVLGRKAVRNLQRGTPLAWEHVAR
jgi:pseudaminic acid synthase